MLDQCIENINIDILSNITDCHISLINNKVLYTKFKADKEYIIIIWDVDVETTGFKNELSNKLFNINSDYGMNLLM